jgi:hypothetical protein
MTVTYDKMTCFKFATINFNGLYLKTRVGMLRDFLWGQDIDVIVLQEVTHHTLQGLHAHETYVNVVTDMRGTEFVTKQDLRLTNINKLPSGRGSTAYLPHRKQQKKKRETEHFYSSEITYLFQDVPGNILLGGDLNLCWSLQIRPVTRRPAGDYHWEIHGYNNHGDLFICITPQLEPPD